MSKRLYKVHSSLTNQSLRLEVFDLETRRDGPQDRYDAAADGDNGELYIVFSLSV